MVITASHVIRGRDIAYVPDGGAAVEVERVQIDSIHDAAVLWLVSDVEFLPTQAARRGAEWRVASPPPGKNDPLLHGTVTTARTEIQNARGQSVEVVQLEISEMLGDFGGYSGSAVLDSLERTVLALLVEQKPLRTPAALGERRPSSNVLYAIPISDVIRGLGLPARIDRPSRFNVGLSSPGMVTRHALLDEAVNHLLSAEEGPSGAGLVLLRGPGGVGKTVLARQIAGDVRVWAEFTDGIVMLRAGPTADADAVAEHLQETLACQGRQLKDALDGQRLLLVVDDVWDRELLTRLQGGLPSAVTILATTRGAFVRDSASVVVGAVSRDEALQILARDTTRTCELDRALGDLSDALFRWALLLTLAAGEIHRDDEFAWELSNQHDTTTQYAEPDSLIQRANALQAQFPTDPTMLDDLERAPESTAPRSVDVLLRRSLEWLGPEHRACFDLLAVYPAGAPITQQMLEDLWQKPPQLVRKEANLLVRSGLAYLVQTDYPTIALHDLIAAWLHHANGEADDPAHQQVHQRLAELCIHADNSPGELTRDRAEWLGHHLVSARAWTRLGALPTFRWRTAFLTATGSDAVFLATLDHYASTATRLDPEILYPVVRAWLFAAHVRALIGAIPLQTLEAMAVIGEPIAAVTQACQHPKAEQAVRTVLAALRGRLEPHLLQRAATITESIPDNRERCGALVAIAGRLAEIDPVQAMALFKRAAAMSESDSRVWGANLAMIGIVRHLADVKPADPTLLKFALSLAERIPDNRWSSDLLPRLAARLADIDPVQASALFDRAVSVAESTPASQGRAEAMAATAERLAALNQDRAMALFGRAMDAAEIIGSESERDHALTRIIWGLGAIGAAHAMVLFERAAAVANSIHDGHKRSNVLAAVAVRIAAIDPPDPGLLHRALTVAETIPDDWDRGRALNRIAQRLADVDLPDSGLFEHAVAVAEAFSNVGTKSAALADIAQAHAGVDPPRALALLEQALAAADTISFEEEASHALAAAAWRLASTDPVQAVVLFERAADAAGTIPYAERSSQALAGIAKKLAEIDPARATSIFERAIDVAQAVSNDEEYSETLAQIAKQMTSIQSVVPQLLERATIVAESIPDDQVSSEALAGIAEAVATNDPPQAARLLEMALSVARTISDYEGNREWALARFAGCLAVVDPGDTTLLNLAVALADSIPADWQRSDALAHIAGTLAGIDQSQAVALLERALALTETVTEREGERSAALETVSTSLALVNPADPQLVDRALAVAHTIEHPASRSDALAGIAGGLAGTDPADPALLDHAVAVAETIPHAWTRSDALALIVDRLIAVHPADPRLLERAVAVAGAIPDVEDRSRVMTGVAVRLADIDHVQAAALLDQAVAMAEEVSDDRMRCRAMAGVAGRLADIDRARAEMLIDRAVTAAGGIREATLTGEDGRDAALGNIAEQLVESNPRVPALTDQAISVAEEIASTWSRSLALEGIVRRLADVDPIDPVLLGRALAIATTIPADERRAQAIAYIVWQLAEANSLNPSSLKRAEAVVNTIPDEWKPEGAVSRINAKSKGGMLNELSRWRQRPLADNLDMVSAFLKSASDKEAAKMIGLAALHVANEFSTQATTTS